MKAILLTFLFTISCVISYSQSWQDVGGGTNNSSHGMLVWDGKLVNLGSYNNPCQRVSTWDGTNWNCLGGGVGIVARAGCVWQGKLVVVGDFWNNFQPCVGCNGVAVWDGSTWSALDDGFNNDVLTCTVYNGELIIGGDFTQANGVPCSRVVRWNELSSTFESLGTQVSFGNDVRCMTEYDGDLWVGGDFNNVDGCSACDGLVKWDDVGNVWEGGNSGVDLVGGVNESVRVLYVNPNDGNLYMGGEFPELWDGDAVAQDFDMGGIAMYDGSNWFPLGTGLNEYCRAIHEYNGYLIAGGYFTDAGGTPANKIAKWDAISGTWSAMGLGFDASGIDEYVKSAAVWNGIFFAGGAYTQAEGAPMNYISQWYEPPTSPPTAGINASATSVCSGGCIDFLDMSANAATSWSWSFPGASTTSSTAEDPGSICYPTAGSYTVQLEACNLNGCDITTTNIVIEDIPTVSVNNPTICDGSSATITATPSTGGGTYLWAPGGATTSSISVSPSTTTTYSVEYTLNGCSSSLEVSTVTVDPVPTVTSNSAFICLGDNVSLTASPSTGGGTYAWTPTSEITQTIVVSPLTSTVYGVTYTLNGCSSTLFNASVDVLPTYALNESVSVCEGDLITYPDGSTETITASTSHNSNLSTVIMGCDSIITTSVVMAPDYSGSENSTVCSGDDFTYPDGTTSTNITVAESHVSNLFSIQGCDSVITTNVAVTNAYNLSENVPICSGSNYTYPDGTVSNNVTVNESHVSNLFSVGGCDSIVTTSLNVTSTINTTEDVSVCSGDSYIYPDGTVSNNLTTNESHVSNLIANGGCDSIVTTNITVTVLPDNTTTLTGNTLNSNQAGATYQWLDCDNGNSPISGESNQTFSPTINGSYAVQVTLNGCSSTSICTTINTIGFDEQELSFTIYPNPVHGLLRIESNDQLVGMQYEIFDSRGRVVLNGLLEDQIEIDVSILDRGVYIFKLASNVQLRFVKI